MLFACLFLLISYIGSTKLLKYGESNTNIYTMINDPMRYFRPNDTVKTVKSQRTLNLDDIEDNSGEVYSSEVDSTSEDFGYRRAAIRKEQKRMDHSSFTGISSTSIDTHEFKKEWVRRWDELKEDAFHPKNAHLRPGGDVVNMVAASK